MKIIIAKDAGYCFGVRDAVQSAYDMSEKYGEVYMLGDIVHNESVVNDLEEKGVKVFVDPGAVMYLLGTQMDFKEEEFSSTFVFKNHNETERCGCGESFKI